ncbi:MAG: hypothetical protein PF549_04105, partial [Patescibacteria group bacterium]|nr:hypothetical protein [Patescibacteria group bacterium]
KKVTTILFLVIFLLGIFLRVYQYHDWLFFKWDQARDAMVAAEAVEKGPGYLPLLGPRATQVGDDYLRLGPAFYYSQYISGAIFQSTAPSVFAFPDTFFAILTIPLLFFFSRLYFNRFNSLAITALYTFSFLIIQYSRFAWNPNTVPFLMILTFFAMFMTMRTQDYKKRLGWLATWSVAFLRATPYHFFAFFSLIAITAVYFFFYLETWKLKEFFNKTKNFFDKKTIGYILVPLFIFGIIYSPVIVSDAGTNWSNSKNFIEAFSEKPRDDKTSGEKLLRNFREQGNNYNLITTSFWTRSGKKADPYPVGFGLFLMASGIFLTIYQRRKTDNKNKRDFLLLLPIWIVMFFLITISTSYQLRPRYFVVVFPVPFIVLGLWFSFLQKRFRQKNLGIILTVIISTAFLLMNFYGTAAWFKDQYISQKQSFPTDRDFILKKEDGVTLGQLERIADYICDNYQDNKIAFYSKAEYKQPMIYLINQRKLEKLEGEPDHISGTGELANYDQVFAINTISGGIDSVSDRVKDYAEVISSEEIGQLVIFEMKVSRDKVNSFVDKKIEEEKEEEEEDENFEDNPESAEDEKTERLLWRDVLN